MSFCRDGYEVAVAYFRTGYMPQDYNERVCSFIIHIGLNCFIILPFSGVGFTKLWTLKRL